MAMDHEKFELLTNQNSNIGNDRTVQGLLDIIETLEKRLESYESKTNRRLHNLEKKNGLSTQGLESHRIQKPKRTPKKLAYQFATSGWCYGLSHIFKLKNGFFRHLWTIAVILSTIMCAYMIWKTMSEFLAFSVVTEFQNIEPRALIFPQITICGFWLSQPPLEEIYEIKICRANFKDDCINDFEYIDVYDYSLNLKCFRINSGKNETGHWQGIRHQTRQKHTENGYNFVINTVAKNKPLTNNVYIHDYPYQPIYSSPHFALNDGDSVAVRLHKTVDQKLPYPFNECVEEQELETLAQQSDLIQKTIDYNGRYSKDQCNFVCFFMNMSQVHNCSFPGVYDDGKRDKCEFEGWTNIHNDFDYEANCFDVCPRECNSIKYEYEPQDLAGVAAVGDNVIPLTNSSFSLCIYFEDLRYTLITQKPKTTWADLISKIGGLLGLFVGVRLLSLMDIFQFVLELGQLVLIKRG